MDNLCVYWKFSGLKRDFFEDWLCREIIEIAPTDSHVDLAILFGSVMGMIHRREETGLKLKQSRGSAHIIKTKSHWLYSNFVDFCRDFFINYQKSPKLELDLSQ